jgi:glycosyltransferase involved in cell wall biosynthesis
MAYGPQIIASEVHSELGREFRDAHNSFAVLSLQDYGSGGEAGATPFEGEEGVVPLHTLSFQNSFARRLGRKIVARLFHYAFFIELVLGLMRFLRRARGNYDIAHVEAAYPLGAAFSIASWLTRSKLPFVVNLQGADVMSLPDYDYGYGRFWLPRRLLRFTFKRCYGVRANSEQTAKLALELGADPARVEVVYRNISDQIYPPAALDITKNKEAQQAFLRQRYNLKPGPVLLAYSRLHPFKGLDFLVRAVPILTQRWPDLNLLICGPSRKTPGFGDYRDYLTKIAAEVGALNNITFTGKIDFAHSADYLAGADLLVVPSVVEALNKVVIEAAAVGTPSVITDTTGIAQAAVAGGVGISVAAQDTAALAEGIATLLSDPERRHEMSEKGRGWAHDFSSRAIAARLLAFYNRVCVKNHRLGYVAYPSSLTLKSANALQTFTTCRELRQLAPDTTVLLPRLPGRPSRFEEIGATHLPRLPFNYFNNFKALKRFPWSYAERTVFVLEVALYLIYRHLSGRGIRTIYVRDVICAYWLVRWRKLLRIKVIYEAHDLEARNPSRAKSRWLRRWLNRVDRTVVGKSDRLVSLTQAFLDYANEQGLRAASGNNYRGKNRQSSIVNRQSVIPDAYDSNIYRPFSEREREIARQLLKWGAGEFVIVYSGLTFAYRSLDKLVIAFARFVEKYPDVPARLVFIGGRPFEQVEIKEQASHLNISQKVECVGQQEAGQINLCLNAASLLAIPDTVTDITASPLKLFEYAAVARPVMLPDIAALREILSDDQALYFERGSITGMLGAIETAYNDPEEAARRARSAGQHVQQYTYANRAKAILDLV